MKAITLYQPWAHLVALGIKKFETRSWATKHRGWLGVHASVKRIVGVTPAGINPELFGGVLSNTVREAMEGSHVIDKSCFGQEAAAADWAKTLRSTMVFGALIAIVEVLDCIQTEAVQVNADQVEYFLGDFGPGRWAWKLGRVLAFDPIPMLGHQGLWNLPDTEQVRKVMELVDPKSGWMV